MNPTRRLALALILSAGLIRRASARMVDATLQADGWPKCDTPKECRFRKSQSVATDSYLTLVTPCQPWTEVDRAGNITGGHSCPPPEPPKELWECVTCKAQFEKPGPPVDMMFPQTGSAR